MLQTMSNKTKDNTIKGLVVTLCLALGAWCFHTNTRVGVNETKIQTLQEQHLRQAARTERALTATANSNVAMAAAINELRVEIARRK